MSDATGSGFGKFVPGFDFLQNLATQAAGGVAQGLGNSLPQMPNLSHWVAPTFNVEELDKRIEELKAVHFWLDQNAKALGATIQALEVQKMTLATLQNMNFSLGDVANALKVKAADTVAGLTGKPTFAGLEIPPRTYGNPSVAEPDEETEADVPPEPPQAEAPAPSPAQSRRARSARSAPAAPPSGGVVDPMQWWGALSQQFQTIAANAMKDVARQTALDTTRSVASGLTEQAVKTATGMAGKAAGSVARNVGAAVGMGQAAARAVGSAARQPASRKTPSAQRAAVPEVVTRQPATRKAAPKKPTPRKASSRKSASAADRVPAQPLSPGDWTLPAAFFPGLQAMAPAKPAAKKAAPKPATRATPRRR